MGFVSRENFAIKGIASPDSDLAGFNIYKGTASRDYRNIAYQPGILNYRDIDVQEGVTYYYVVTAVGTSGNESEFSALNGSSKTSR